MEVHRQISPFPKRRQTDQQTNTHAYTTQERDTFSPVLQASGAGGAPGAYRTRRPRPPHHLPQPGSGAPPASALRRPPSPQPFSLRPNGTAIKAYQTNPESPRRSPRARRARPPARSRGHTAGQGKLRAACGRTGTGTAFARLPSPPAPRRVSRGRRGEPTCRCRPTPPRSLTSSGR